MRKFDFWKTDWFLGVVVVVVLVVALFNRFSDLVPSLERKAYDLGVIGTSRTPSFMSPEHLAGKKIEGRSDLFSLAVSLYQLLSGKLPFEGESMAQLMFKIASESPADILAVNPSVAPGLVAFLARALAKNPDERFQTGAEFASALRAAASEEPAPALAMAGAGGVDIEL